MLGLLWCAVSLRRFSTLCHYTVHTATQCSTLIQHLESHNLTLWNSVCATDRCFGISVTDEGSCSQNICLSRQWMNKKKKKIWVWCFPNKHRLLYTVRILYVHILYTVYIYKQFSCSLTKQILSTSHKKCSACSLQMYSTSSAARCN